MTSSTPQTNARSTFGSLQLGGWLVWCALILIILTLSYTCMSYLLVSADQSEHISKPLRRLTPAIVALLAGIVAALQLYSKPGGLAGRLALIVFVGAAAFGARKPNFAFEAYVLGGGILMVGAFWLAGRFAALRSWFNFVALSLAAGTVLLAIVEAFLVISFYSGLGQMKTDTEPAEDLASRPANFFDLFEGEPSSATHLGGGLRPGLDHPMLVEDGELGRVRTNADGFRSDVPSTLPKPTDEFRVLLLGDSFSIGFRSDDAVYLAGQLEARLQAALDQIPSAPARKVQVYAAWTQDQVLMAQWLERFQSSRFFEADLILHGVCLGNDLAWNHFHGRIETTREARMPKRFLDEAHYSEDQSYDPHAQFNLLRSRLQLGMILRRRLTATPIWNGLPVRSFGVVPIWNSQNNIGIFLKDESITAPLFASFRKYLRQAHATLSRTPDAPPMHVFLFPQRFQQSEQEWSVQVGYYGLKPEAFDRELPNRKIAAMCADEQWNCFDLLPAFKARGNRLLYLPFDMHWNGAGNTVAAEAVAKYLLGTVNVFNTIDEDPPES